MKTAASFIAAVTATMAFSINRTALAAGTTAEHLEKYLKNRVTQVDSKKPVRISVSGGNGTGEVADLRISGAPVILKDVRAERVEAHASKMQLDHAKLVKENELVVSSVKDFYLSAEVTSQALTDRVNAGKNTKELSATVSFAGGKAFIKGKFKYSFVKGNFDAQLTPTIKNNNQIVFLIDKLKVGGVPAPASVRKILQNKMAPLDMGDLVGAPKIDKVWFEGDRMKVVGGKPF